MLVHLSIYLLRQQIKKKNYTTVSMDIKRAFDTIQQ